MIKLEYYLIVSTLMFFIGIFGFITRKSMIAILISLELVLNAVEINFAAFNRYLFPEQMEGMFFTIFGIAITAAETAVALAIIINAYRLIGDININDATKMKG
ncbi:MAG: NADH-quinone oxidoreductase subunit NuoK [Bacteroidota bacterium]|jgi:NADH-quinone oxidoreductase subunit K|nr:NADH dehydrogenase I, K subunit [Bacteroidetes oral taxon 274 str. F0058]MBF0976339.1 NADH-quinone oxidoreductase subunit NuoK [Bacteroidota bacterium]RKV88071.1 MAG: NADH-quinone oxidoreductase subunit NuoK [Bacteroidota bacterium]